MSGVLGNASGTDAQRAGTTFINGFKYILAYITDTATVWMFEGTVGGRRLAWFTDLIPAFFGGVMSAVPTKAITGFTTWLNQGSMVEIDVATGMNLSTPGEGSVQVVRGLTKAAPSTPYTSTFLVSLPPSGSGSGSMMFGWYDGSNKLDVVAITDQNSGLWEFAEYKWTNPTTFDASVAPSGIYVFWNSAFIWVRLADNGTTVSVSVSSDGVNFFQVMTQAKSSGWNGASGYNNLYVGFCAYNEPMASVIQSYAEAA